MPHSDLTGYITKQKYVYYINCIGNLLLINFAYEAETYLFIYIRSTRQLHHHAELLACRFLHGLQCIERPICLRFHYQS